MAEVLGDMRHGLGRAGQLAAALLTAGLDVAPRGRVQVAGRLQIESGFRRGVSFAELRDSVVGAVQVAADPFGRILRAEPGGGRRQFGIAAIEQSGVAGMVGGAGQVVGDGPILMERGTRRRRRGPSGHGGRTQAARLGLIVDAFLGVTHGRPPGGRRSRS